MGPKKHPARAVKAPDLGKQLRSFWLAAASGTNTQMLVARKCCKKAKLRELPESSDYQCADRKTTQDGVMTQCTVKTSEIG